MKLALIPPFELVGWAAHTDYQLMLPHLVDNPAYRVMYRDLASDPKNFVILDNGVAEGEMIPFDKIIRIAKTFQVDEVVLPDVLFDGEATAKAVDDAFSTVTPTQWPGHYMYVIQGRSAKELEASINHALSHMYVDTIGIPRHLPMTLQDEAARWKIARLLRTKYHAAMSDRDIHFLGMHPAYPKELEIRQLFELPDTLVRGVDTSAPFNFAYGDARMADGGTAARPEHYFLLDQKYFSPELVYANVEYLKGLLR